MKLSLQGPEYQTSPLCVLCRLIVFVVFPPLRCSQSLQYDHDIAETPVPGCVLILSLQIHTLNTVNRYSLRVYSVREYMCEQCRVFSVRIWCSRPCGRHSVDRRRDDGKARTASRLCLSGIVDTRARHAVAGSPLSTLLCLSTKHMFICCLLHVPWFMVNKVEHQQTTNDTMVKRQQ